LLYTDIIISGIAAAIDFFLLIYSAIRVRKDALGGILLAMLFFSITAMVSLSLSLSGGLEIPAGAARAGFHSGLILTILFLFNFTVVFPDKKFGKKALISIATAVPPAAVSLWTVLSEVFFESEKAGLYGTIGNETLEQCFIGLCLAYTLSAAVISAYKSFRLRNLAYRRDLLYISSGLAALSLTGLFFSPVFMHLYESLFSPNSGLTITVHLAVLTVFYSTAFIDSIDIKKFYLNIFFWILIFLLLFGPVAVAVKFGLDYIYRQRIPSIGFTFIIIIYLFLFYKFIKPKIEELFQRGYWDLSTVIDGIFRQETRIGAPNEGESSWEASLKSSVKGLIDKFNIESGVLYIYDARANDYYPAFSEGVPIQAGRIKTGEPIIRSLASNQRVVDISYLYSGIIDSEFKSETLDFFTGNNIRTALPLFSRERELIGFLFISNLPRNKKYSKTYMSALELYRIIFQQRMSNIMLLEKTKVTQIVEHDKMVVDSIKKKIIPKKLIQVDGIRISSFYINNSMYGGDYFDSVRMGEERLCIFMTDSSYSGIDSALVSLEMYTVLHSSRKGMDSPEKILNTMNWIISSSRFTKRYAPSCCLMYYPGGELRYSNAAFNPLLIYDPSEDSFIEHDLQNVPIGVGSEVKYSGKTIKPAPGSIGVLYSDGLISAINGEGESYSLEKIKPIIRENRGSTPAVAVRKVFEDFNDFISGKNQVCDVSLIVFKI
jgi:sigma-B regulation protein RsbU (phosphoserine phosphatase)